MDTYENREVWPIFKASECDVLPDLSEELKLFCESLAKNCADSLSDLFIKNETSGKEVDLSKIDGYRKVISDFLISWKKKNIDVKLLFHFLKKSLSDLWYNTDKVSSYIFFERLFKDSNSSEISLIEKLPTFVLSRK